MRIFEISVNGEVVCNAGLSGESVVTAIVTSQLRKSRSGDFPDGAERLEDKLDLSIGGFDCESNSNIQWLIQKLEDGDEVSVKIVQGSKEDISPGCVAKFDIDH